MRKMYLLVAIIMLLGISFENQVQVNDQGKKISFIEVKVPCTEVYDAGIYRKVYSLFQIFDASGNKVLGVSQKYDRPAQFKLSEGDYTLIIDLSNGKLIEKEITVFGNQFEVIQMN
ncbi:MAG: hypothetical protein IH619_05245 [Ignavibacterium sp.]|nr:hypothetical protein [Ignavibacterium sp.]